MTKSDLLEKLKTLHKSLKVKKLADNPGHNDSKIWLAEVPSILKYFDEVDFQEFCKNRNFLLNEYDSGGRRTIANELDIFVRQKISEYENMLNLEQDTEKTKQSEGIFIPYPRFIPYLVKHFENIISKLKEWFAKHATKIFIGILVTVVGGAILYFFGWS